MSECVCVSACLHRQMGRWIGLWADGWTPREVNRLTGTYINKEQTNKQTDGQIDK